MQKPTALILAVLLIIGGGMFFILNKKPADTGWIPDDPKEKPKITASSSASPSASSGGSVSGSTASGGAISVASDASTNAASLDSTGGSSKATTASSSGASEQTTVDSGAASDSSAANSSTPEKQTEPVAAAPKDSSPPPPPPKPVPSGSLILTESLQYGPKTGRPILGPPKALTSYPIIPPGTSYQGKILSASNLSQADISRLASYSMSPILDFPPPSTKREYINGKWVEQPNNPIILPIGSYASDTGFKAMIDIFVTNAGPHIQRKLQTTEWEFTPAPMASYRFEGSQLFAPYRIRGVLRVKYKTVDNVLKLSPNVWYQSDVEIGMANMAFLTNNPDDRKPRDILMDLVVLKDWGESS